MRHSLKKYLDFYEKVNNVKIYFGEHEIIIEFNKGGSFALIKQFSNLEFDFVKVDKDTLVLSY